MAYLDANIHIKEIQIILINKSLLIFLSFPSSEMCIGCSCSRLTLSLTIFNSIFNRIFPVIYQAFLPLNFLSFHLIIINPVVGYSCLLCFVICFNVELVAY